MNFANSQLMASVNELDATIASKTPEQQNIFNNFRKQIEENGRFYEIAALTVNSMREHGYDVTEQDAGVINSIAEKTEIDPDMLWDAVAVWAEYYGVKQLENY